MNSKTPAGLGRLNSLGQRLKELQCPARSWTLVIFAGDNGISREHTSHFLPLHSGDLVLEHLEVRSPTSKFLKRLDRREWLIDVGLCMDISHPDLIHKRVDKGTRSFLSEDALDYSQVLSALAVGKSAWDLINYQDFDIIGLGEIGVADTLCAAALAIAALDFPEKALVGPGSAEKSVIEKKLQLIRQSIEFRKPDSCDMVDLLARFGGLEIAALTGFILEAGQKNRPVMLDGFVTSVAALLASRLDEKIISHIIAPNLSAEPGHQIILNKMGLDTIFDLSLNYGEGLASVMGLFLAEMTMSFYE